MAIARVAGVRFEVATKERAEAAGETARTRGEVRLVLRSVNSTPGTLTGTSRRTARGARKMESESRIRYLCRPDPGA